MKHTLLSIVALITLAIVFYPQQELISKENGSPGAKTNSPLDGQNCTSCHSGSINSGSGTISITTDIPSGGYLPGNTYTITTTVAQAGINKFGFELTAENLSVKQGTFFITNAIETKFANGTSNTGVTHKQAGTSGTNTKSWDCDWEAPASGTGDITFYSSALAANSNGSNNGDQVYTNSIMISELIPVPGCTDSLALNYDPTATVDDGSCIFCDIQASFWMTSYPLCNNDSNLLSDFSTSSVSIDSWQWIIGGVDTITNNNPQSPLVDLSLYCQNGFLPVELIVTDINGCVSSSNIYPDLFCDEMPGWDINFPDTVCVGDTVVFFDTSYYPAWFGTQSNEFFPGDGTIINSGPNATIEHVYTQDGVYHPWIINYTDCNQWESLSSSPPIIVINCNAIYGCTDPTALNYNPLATIDDSSCVYCTQNQLSIIVGGGTADNDISWSVVEFGGSWASASGSAGNNTACIADNCYLFNMYDVGGNGWNGATYTITDSLGNVLSTGTLASGNSGYNLFQVGVSISCPLPPAENLFFSEYGEGSSNNKYFEIYNPTSDTVDLTNYAFARVNNNPGNGAGVYEYWVDFDSAAIILPNDVYVVVHPSADSLILIEADMDYGSLSNGDDGVALVYGNNPGTPMSPSNGGYQILDWIGDWNGDPGSGWDVAGENNATANHTLIRKCDMIQGDTSWTNAAGTNPANSQWIVLANNDWSDIGQHIISPCNLIYGCMDALACNYDPNAVIDDGSCIYPGQTYQYNISICNGDSALIGGMYYSQAGLFIDSLINIIGCDSIVHTNLIIYSQFNSIFGGIENNTVGGGSFYSGQQSIELSCYMPSELVSAVIYSQDTSLTTFEILDDNGNVLDDTTVNIIPGGHRIYFNYLMSAGSDYELGVNGGSNDLFRNNSGVSYPYNFGSLAAVTSSSAGANYYYFFYDIEIKQTTVPLIYTICDGDSIQVAGNVYDTSGLYIDSLTSYIGCDSLVFIEIITLPNVSYTNNQTICTGGTYVINGNTYDSAGVYIDVLQTVTGCDSIVITQLTVVSPTGVVVSNNQTICMGDSVIVGNNVYYNVGNYTDVLQTINGCDSVVNTTLTVLPENIDTLTIQICDGDSVVIGNSIYTLSGTYADILINSFGCDSVIYTVLEVYQTPSLTIGSVPNPPEICVGDTILLEGSTGFSYYWWDNGSTGSSLLDDPTEDTWYLLSAKDSNDCIAKEDIWVFVDSCITGVNALSFEEGLQVYPNPASEQLTIDFTGNATGIKVYNMFGELVVEKHITEGQSSVQLFVKGWKGAMYSIQLYRENGTITHKVFTVVR